MVIISVADSWKKMVNSCRHRKNYKENMNTGQSSPALDVADYKKVTLFCLKNSKWDGFRYIFRRVSN